MGQASSAARALPHTPPLTTLNLLVPPLQVATGPRVDEFSLPSVTVAPTRPAGEEGPHLPWTGSVAGPEFPLRYMPFLEHLLNVLARSFGEMTALPLADKLAFVENPEKGARMLRCVACIAVAVLRRSPSCFEQPCCCCCHGRQVVGGMLKLKLKFKGDTAAVYTAVRTR